jgi:4,5-DOPA dioxygenase extradiol
VSAFPSIFVSHGAPDLPLRSNSLTDFLRQLGAQLGKPEAILAISAHWLTPVPMVSAAAQPDTIHDFWGFPPELYEISYPAPGAPELTEQVIKQLNTAGLSGEIQHDRGLDHGAWEPLLLMYPDADIPVTQLSLQPSLGTAHHFLLGRALAPLRQEGVLILASGSTTHNLRQFGAYAFDASPPDWVKQFDRWLAETIADQNIDALLDYRRQAPYAVQNHPTEEHFLPLLVALGAAGEEPKGRQIHTSFTYGVFSMAAYAFE